MQIRTLALAIVLAGVAQAQAGEFTALLKERKFAEADRAVAARLAADPRNADALVAKSELALTYSHDARIAEAIAAGEACVAAWPQRSECHEALGNALASKALNGSFLSAMTYAGRIRDSYVQAVTLDPKNFDARTSLLQYYLQAPSIAGGGEDKARNFVAETAKVNAEAGKLLRAALDAGDGKLAAAEAAVLSVNPGDDDQLKQGQRNALATVAYRYLDAKKFGDAERLFREVQKRWPDTATGLTGQARVLQVQGKNAEAVAMYEKAVMIDPRGSNWYRMAQILQGQQEKAKALAAYEKALNARPGLPKKQREDAVDQVKNLKS